MLVLAACGGDGDSGQTESNGDPAAAATNDAEAEADAPASDDAGNAGSGNGAAPGVDLGGTQIDPTSDVSTNLFPDLVVDDVTRAKKVNLRNLIPSEKPVLVWMYAPH